MRRLAIGSIVVGLLATLVVAVPASATNRHGKWAPAIRIYAYANDDGRPRAADPGDVGGISAAYDRWGNRSSDDPREPGMDPARLDSDVARCKARRIGPQTLRMRIQNAYPGYVCSFVVVTINRAGVTLVVDDIRFDVDSRLELTTIDGPEIGDELKRRRRLHGAYAVTVLQEAPQGDTLEFDIQVDFAYEGWRRTPPKCCRRCWR